MLRNYFKIARRTLSKNKTSSIINISGLAAGMAVVFLIGLWIWDEVSFDKNNRNYDRVAEVMQSVNLARFALSPCGSLTYKFQGI